MMKFLRQLLILAVFGILCCGDGKAEIVVVVDARSGVEFLTQDEVINIFMGRHRKLPTGMAAMPIDQPLAGGLRAEFYRKLVDKDLADINAYWARLYFSGKTRPPIQADSASEVLSYVTGYPGAVGYLERKQADARVKIVLVLPP